MINKDIPLPDRMLARGRPLETRWDLMEVGDSVLLPRLGTVNSGFRYARKMGWRMTSRKVKEQPYGWRVWRIE